MIQAVASNLLVVVLFFGLSAWVASLLVRTWNATVAYNRVSNEIAKRRNLRRSRWRKRLTAEEEEKRLRDRSILVRGDFALFARSNLRDQIVRQNPHIFGSETGDQTNSHSVNVYAVMLPFALVGDGTVLPSATELMNTDSGRMQLTIPVSVAISNKADGGLTADGSVALSHSQTEAPSDIHVHIGTSRSERSMISVGARNTTSKSCMSADEGGTELVVQDPLGRTIAEHGKSFVLSIVEAPSVEALEQELVDRARLFRRQPSLWLGRGCDNRPPSTPNIPTSVRHVTSMASWNADRGDDGPHNDDREICAGSGFKLPAVLAPTAAIRKPFHTIAASVSVPLTSDLPPPAWYLVVENSLSTSPQVLPLPTSSASVRQSPQKSLIFTEAAAVATSVSSISVSAPPQIASDEHQREWRQAELSGGSTLHPHPNTACTLVYKFQMERVPSRSEEAATSLTSLHVRWQLAYVRLGSRVYRTLPVFVVRDDEPGSPSAGVVAGASRRWPASAGLCMVCFGSPNHVMAIPCMHMAFCHTCVARLSHCPICRGKISHTLRLDSLEVES